MGEGSWGGFGYELVCEVAMHDGFPRRAEGFFLVGFVRVGVGDQISRMDHWPIGHGRALGVKLRSGLQR